MVYASTRDWSSLYGAIRSEPETAAQSSSGSHLWVEHSRCPSSACIVVGAVAATPVKTFVSNQTPFFLYPTNVSWQLEQTKKTQRSPAADRTRVFRLPVGRSNVLATKPRQELRANFCLSPNCQFCFTTRWPECLSLQTRRDHRNFLDLTVREIPRSGYSHATT